MKNKSDPYQIEPPEEFTYRNVMYWEPDSMELIKLKKDGSKQAATLLTKAEDFLLNDCIVRTNIGWDCLPIEGYNSTTYHIFIDQYSNFACNCQGFVSKVKNGEKGICSHIVAVKQFNFMEIHNG